MRKIIWKKNGKNNWLAMVGCWTLRVGPDWRIGIKSGLFEAIASISDKGNRYIHGISDGLYPSPASARKRAEALMFNGMDDLLLSVLKMRKSLGMDDSVE